MKIQMPTPDVDLPSPAVSLAAIVDEPDTLRLSVNPWRVGHSELGRELPTRPTSLQLTRTQVVGMVDWLVRWLAGELEIDAILVRTQPGSET